jgi:hypothetical protein
MKLSMGGAKPLMANAVCGPTPGIVCSRRAVSFVPARPRAFAVLASIRTVCSDTQDETRATLIQRLVAVHDLPDTWATRMEEAGEELTDDEIRTQARAAAAEALQTRARQTTRIRVVGSQDDPAIITRRQTDALVIRMAGGTPAEDVRPFMGLSALDMARDALTRSGVSVQGLSADDVLTRAMTTSDFPLVVSNAMGKVALASYQAASSPLKILSRQRVLPNFKESTSIRLGEWAALRN